jgi:AraC-like DNA-binding protein
MEHRTADIDLWCRVSFREIRNQALNSLTARRSLAIKEIAARVGYQHSTGLGRHFKHCFGVTPTQWRAMHRCRA